MGPIRDLGARVSSVRLSAIRPIQMADFVAAINVIKPSCNKDMLQVGLGVQDAVQARARGGGRSGFKQAGVL